MVNVVTHDYEVRLFAYRRFGIVLLPIFNTIPRKVGIRNLEYPGLLTVRLSLIMRMTSP